MESGKKQVLNEGRSSGSHSAPLGLPFSRETTQAPLAPQCFISKLREEEENDKHLFHDFIVPGRVLKAYLGALLTRVSGGETISPFNI